jgi:DNA-binding response OmpR family regulator
MTRPPLILITDDDELIRDLLGVRLDLAGYRTVTANDGVSALTAIAEYRPAAMILDLAMPRLDGFGVLSTLRRLGRPIPPTLILTARHATADVRTAMSLGAKDYMAKPFDDQTLLRRVSRLLRSPPQVAAGPAPTPSPPAPPTPIENELFL